MAAEARANSPPSSLRRLSTMPPRSVMAAVMASRSASVEWNSWRSSTKGPWGMRYLPQAVTPKPSGHKAHPQGGRLPLRRSRRSRRRSRTRRSRGSR